MNDLVRFDRGRGLPRPVRQALAVRNYDGLVRAHKLQAVGQVAQLGLLTVASLSELEAQLVRQVPWAEARMSAIVNTAAAVIAAEVANLAME